MSRDTECKKDEDFGTVWGDNGKTARMKAAEQCTKWGYYNARIHDCGGWRFRATCSDKPPSGWSLPYSDESAKSLGFSNRNEAAKANCKSRGYDSIQPNEWRDKGWWQFSVKCANVKWDAPVTGKDGNGSNITIQKCNNWVNNDVNSCNSSTKPKGIKKWIACGIGSSPGGIAPGDGARACSPATDNFSCKWGQNCFAITNHDVVWDKPVTGKDGNGSNITIQKCNGWVNNDPNSCKNSPSKPKGIKKWINCGIGSSPGGIAPGDGAGACSPVSDKFSCKWGQNCFAITNHDVVWDKPVSGCDGAGTDVTIQKCNGWVDNDPNSCRDSPSKPKGIKKWINCGIGSSPGGIAPGDGARACSSLSDSFSCAWGQNCFAVTKADPSDNCETNFFSDPGTALEDFRDGYRMQLIISVVVIIIVLSLSALIIFSIKSK